MKFTPYVYRVDSYRVKDGDTVEVSIDLGFKLSYSISVRLEGVNTPETKGAQKVTGLLVKAFVDRWLTSRKDKLLVRSAKLDKYADRVIGDLVAGDDSLVAALRERKFVTAVSADGTVTPFTPEQLAYIERVLG